LNSIIIRDLSNTLLGRGTNSMISKEKMAEKIQDNSESFNEPLSCEDFCPINKKIAFFDIYDPIPINSGGDWYRYQLLTDLDKDNEVTEYFTTIVKNKGGYTPLDFQFERVFISGNEKWLNLVGSISPKVKMIRPELRLLTSEINKIKTDLILTIVECYHIAKQVSKNNNNAPIIIVMHNVEWKYLKGIGSPFYIPMKYYENFVLSKADAVISISANGAKYASHYSKSNKIFHIPPQTDLIFHPEGEKYCYGDDKFNLLFYGSLDREQNVHAVKFIKNELIPLLEKENLMEKVRMNIFGSGIPPKYLELETDVNINFLGTVDDPGKYIRGADLVLVPLKNSSGIKFRIIESLSCGKPIIATPEAVENLPDDLKVNIHIQKNVHDFVDVIKKFISPEPVATIINL